MTSPSPGPQGLSYPTRTKVIIAVVLTTVVAPYLLAWSIPKALAEHDDRRDPPATDGDALYFGDRAGPVRRGYYSVRSATWRVLMLNSQIPIARGSAQLDLRAGH